MPTYEYINTKDRKRRIEADTPEMAISGAKNIAPTSGVRQVIPTVISDTRIRDKVIPQIGQEAEMTLAKADQKNQLVAQEKTGRQQRADEKEKNKDPMQGIFEEESEFQVDPYSQKQLDLIDKLLESSDDNVRRMAARQRELYDRQRSDAMRAGTREQGAMQTGLTRLGGRYTPGLSGQVAAQVQRSTNEKLAQIDDDEMAAVDELRMAQENRDFELMQDKLDLLKGIREERMATIEAAREAEKEERDALAEGVNDILLSVSKSGAPTEVRMAISQATTIPEAIDAAGDWLQTASGDAGDYLFYRNDSLRRGLEPMTSEEWFAAKAAESMIGGLSKEQNQALNQLKGQMRLDADVKNFIEVRDGYERVQTGANLNNSQGDLSLLFGYMKMLDPTSVVRETEFANAETAMGYVQKVLNIPDKVVSGDRLTEQGRKDFADAARRLYNSKKAQYDKAIDYYGEEADAYGIPRERLIRDFGTTYSDNEESAKERIIEMGNTDPQVRDTVLQFFNDYPEATYSDALQLFGESPISLNRPQRNNNPLNIKASTFTKSYPGVAGTDPKPAEDGGQFLVFETPEAGFNAAKKLLASANYANLTVDQAMRRWSNNGYGGDVLPRFSGRKINTLTQSELDALVQAMASREGYFA